MNLIKHKRGYLTPLFVFTSFALVAVSFASFIIVSKGTSPFESLAKTDNLYRNKIRCDATMPCPGNGTCIQSYCVFNQVLPLCEPAEYCTSDTQVKVFNSTACRTPSGGIVRCCQDGFFRDSNAVYCTQNSDINNVMDTNPSAQ